MVNIFKIFNIMHLDQECECVEEKNVSCWFPLFKSVSNFFSEKNIHQQNLFHLYIYAPFISNKRDPVFIYVHTKTDTKNTFVLSLLP